MESGSMLDFFLCLSSFFAAAYGSNDNQFIADVMKSQEVHLCDFGYIYDQQKPKISFDLLDSLERWCNLVSSSYCPKRKNIFQAIHDKGN